MNDTSSRERLETAMRQATQLDGVYSDPLYRKHAEAAATIMAAELEQARSIADQLKNEVARLTDELADARSKTLNEACAERDEQFVMWLLKKAGEYRSPSREAGPRAGRRHRAPRRQDIEGRFTYASPSFCELLGAPLDEILGRTDFDFYPRDLAEKYRADDLSVLRNRRVLNDVEVNQTADGRKAHVQVFKMPILDAAGQPVGIQGIFCDVTARLQAEEQLRESEARKRAILETAMDCILFLDERGVIVEANRSALETLRCRRRDVIDRELAEILASPGAAARYRVSLAR